MTSPAPLDPTTQPDPPLHSLGGRRPPRSLRSRPPAPHARPAGYTHLARPAWTPPRNATTRPIRPSGCARLARSTPPPDPLARRAAPSSPAPLYPTTHYATRPSRPTRPVGCAAHLARSAPLNPTAQRDSLATRSAGCALVARSARPHTVRVRVLEPQLFSYPHEVHVAVQE